MNNLELSGNITVQNITDAAPTFTSRYIDLYIRNGQWNLSFVVLKHFESEFLHREPSCCLDVHVKMCVLLRYWARK